MSKNIIIQEGGTDYQITANKLKTNKVGGGTVLWIPEDEANLKTKRITENGKYIASNDGAYGFKSVNINVKGGKGSANSAGSPVVTYDSDGYVENAPGGVGSAVYGTDTNTGEWVTVGVDSSGNLVTTPIPSGIEIVTPPTKTSYVEGETIDYSGISVNLKNKSGGTFTNATYPNGKIPINELIFTVTSASESSGSQTIPVSWNSPYSGTLMTDSFNIYVGDISNINSGTVGTCRRSAEGSSHEITFTTGSGLLTYYSSTLYTWNLIAASATPGTAITRIVSPSGETETTPLLQTYTKNNKTVYYTVYSGTSSSPITYLNPSTSNIGLSNEEVAWYMIYGNSDYGGYSDDSGGSSSGGGGGF